MAASITLCTLKGMQQARATSSQQCPAQALTSWGSGTVEISPVTRQLLGWALGCAYQ